MVIAALPGRAQEGSGARYAFADTTLLRDTLDLSFPQLFPLADSLQVTPDSLRAFSVRYRLSLDRLVHLADSLGVPVDSVGPVLVRERFNPLAAGTGRRSTFAYNSSYSVGQTQSAWRNAADYSFGVGSAFVQNSTTVQMDRYRAGAGTRLQQTRSSATELGWRFSPDFSLGGRVNMEWYDSRDPSSSSDVFSTKNEYQVSMRSRQKPLPGLSSTLNFFAGMLDLQESNGEKRGVSGNMNTRIRHTAGSWLSQEVNGSVDGNLSRTRDQTSATSVNTRDFSQNARGSLSLFASAPIGLRSNFNYKHLQNENLEPSGAIRRRLTDQSGVDGTVRLRLDNDRYVDLTQRLSVTKSPPTRLGATTRNTRRDDGFSASARYLFRGWSVESRFSNGFGNSTYPTAGDSGGFSEFLHSRSLDGTVNKQLSSRLTAQISANLALTSNRYGVVGTYPRPPVSRDIWRQSWRVKGSYVRSTRFNTSLSLEVAKNREINIAAASTGGNNDNRVYRSEWNWSYRLLPGLTATQSNTLSADYTEYPFFPDNNRLSLVFGANTTLNAVVTPRLSVTVTHATRRTPAGNYILYPDNLYYFERADEGEDASLRAAIAYTPSPAISFSFRPGYFASERAGSVNGVQVPQRASRNLDFSGGANINWPIGSKGALRGDIARNYQSARTTTYTSGVAFSSPRSELSSWNGSLQLSWQL
jgi:hypothetical protein